MGYQQFYEQYTEEEYSDLTLMTYDGALYFQTNAIDTLECDSETLVIYGTVRKLARSCQYFRS